MGKEQVLEDCSDYFITRLIIQCHRKAFLGISHAVVVIVRSEMHLFHETGLAVTIGINLCGNG